MLHVSKYFLAEMETEQSSGGFVEIIFRMRKDRVPGRSKSTCKSTVRTDKK